jgi:hypothetical protein
LRSCANLRRRIHTSSIHLGCRSTSFYWSTLQFVVGLPGRKVQAGCLPHMAWEAWELGLFPDRVHVILVHLGDLLLVPLICHVLQTAVGCCHTLVDIGVVLRSGISVWGAVRKFVALHLLAHHCSWSSLPFDSSWLALVM